MVDPLLEVLLLLDLAYYMSFQKEGQLARPFFFISHKSQTQPSVASFP